MKVEFLKAGQLNVSRDGFYVIYGSKVVSGPFTEAGANADLAARLKPESDSDAAPTGPRR